MDVDQRTKEHEERFLNLFRIHGCENIVNLYCNALEAQRDSIVVKLGETERITKEGFHKSDPETFDAQIKFLRESGHTSPDVWARTWAREMRDPRSPVAKAIEDMCATARWLIPEDDDEEPKMSHSFLPHISMKSNWQSTIRKQIDDDPMPSELLTADLMALHAVKGPEVFTKLFCAALEEQPDLDPLDMTELLDGNKWIDIEPKDHLFEGHELTSEDEDAMTAIRDERKETATDLSLEYDKMLVATQIEFFRKHGARIPANVLANVLANEVELGDQQTTEIMRTMGIDL